MELRYSDKPLGVEERDDKRYLVGYAGVYYREGNPDTQFQMYEDIVERIMPGAFEAMAREDDVRGVVNHDPSKLLARSRAGQGTMKLTADEIGLRYEMELGDSQVANETVRSIQRGDLSGSSFAFTLKPRGDVNWREEGGVSIREITNLTGHDVGPVTYPAYLATSADVRSSVRAERDCWRRERDDARNAARIEEIDRELALLDMIRAGI